MVIRTLTLRALPGWIRTRFGITWTLTAPVFASSAYRNVGVGSYLTFWSL